MKFILHIGPHKTGSSYIQLECAQRRQELLQNGLLYPHTWNRKGFSHDAIYDQLRQQHYKFFSLNSQKMLQEVGPDTKVIILSTENMELLNSEAVRMLFSHFPHEQTTIVYYVRAWPALLYSTWQESVKHGATITFPEHALQHLQNPGASPVLNYGLALLRYAYVFGSDQIVLRSYDNIVQKGENIFEDLISVCLGAPSPLRGRKIFANVSLSPLDIEIVRLLNLIIFGASGAVSAEVRTRYFQLKQSSPELEPILEELEAIATPYSRRLLLSADSPNFRRVEGDIISSYRNIGPRDRSDQLFNEHHAIEVTYYASDLFLDEKVRRIVGGLALEVQRGLAQPLVGAARRHSPIGDRGA